MPRRLILAVLLLVGLAIGSGAGLLDEEIGIQGHLNHAEAASGALTHLPPNYNFDAGAANWTFDGPGVFGGGFSCSTSVSFGGVLICPNRWIYSDPFQLSGGRLEVPYEWVDTISVAGYDDYWLNLTVEGWLSGGWNTVYDTVTVGCDAPCGSSGGILVADGMDAQIGQLVRVKLTNITGKDTVRVDNIGRNLANQKIQDEVITGDPFGTSSGQMFHSNTDISVPGKGIPLEFSRSYVSMSDHVGLLGNNWTSNYSWVLRIDANSSVEVRYADGHAEYFNYNAGTFTPRAGVYETLVKNGDNTYTLTTKDQIRVNFSTTGKLSTIVDRNGNTTAVSYDGSGFIDEVEDAGGRVLDFTTDGSGRVIEIRIH
jgi:YD repeat-containing protein